MGDDGRTIEVRDNAGTSPTLKLFQDVGGLPSVQVYNAGGDAELAWLVGSGMNLSNLTGDITIPPARIEFSAPVVRKFDIPALGGFVVPPLLSDFAPAGPPNEGTLQSSDTGAVVYAPVRVPHGCTITAVRVYGQKTDTTAYLGLELVRAPKGGSGGSTARVSLVTADNDGGAADVFTVEATLSHTVNQTSVYWLEVTAGAPVPFSVWLIGAEVEYEETRPFDGA